MKRKNFFPGIALFGLFSLMIPDIVLGQRQMEKLDRGLVAYRIGDPVMISWRIFGNEYYNAGYNIYRGSKKLNLTPITGPGYYIDYDSIYDSTYTVTAVINGVEQPPSSPAAVWGQHYKDIPVQIPPAGTTPPYTVVNKGVTESYPNGQNYNYSPNDCSVGDVDGDGEYEIILKWDPSNSRDNSYGGYTGKVYLDAYELNGTHLWRIDLGINIRAGAHYTQFMVYDLDGDGKAEVACKTAPGTRDASGNYLKFGPANGADHEADYRNAYGFILSGPEYFTIFEGETGHEIVTVDYDPPRGSIASWGDSDGNRVDRFLACVAYLDGSRPSVVMCRGYYRSRSGILGRTVLAAWDYRNDTLTKRWTFSADMNADYPGYTGQGNHNLSVADVDDDGKDEIIYGSCAIDDDGTGLYTTGLGHGDALHVSDLDPARPGLEVFAPHENKKDGVTFRDAATGAVIWQKPSDRDVGRALAADVLPNHKGAECWGASGLGMYNCKGAYVGTIPSINFAIWWDSDDLRELLDGESITKYNGAVQLTASGCIHNNGSKSNPCLQADILGDWREEVIFRLSNNSAIRLFTTKSGTSRRMYTLMHDPVYRLGIAWQNVAYNQPPHTGFYFGDGREAPPPPISSGQLTWNAGQAWDIQTSENWTVNGIPSFYKNGDNVLFDITGSNANPIELKDTIKPSVVTVYSTTDYKFNGTGSLSGGMRLIKAGSGTLTIDTDNDYTGETSVWGGELFFNGILSQSHVVVNNFSGTGGRGTFSKGVSIPWGGNLTVGSKGEADTLRIIDSLYFGSGGKVYFDLSDDISGLSKTNDILLVNGDITILGKTIININQMDDKLGAGKYKLMECTGSLSTNINDLQMEGLLGVPYEITKTDSTFILEALYVRPASSIFWKGDQSDVWDLISTFNWINSDTADWFVKNDTVIFDDSGSSATTIQMAGSLPVGEMRVNSTLDYTFEGAGFISGKGKLIKNGTGTLALSASNTYTGGTSVNEGILMINNVSGSATGPGEIDVHNGTTLSGTGMVDGPVEIHEGGALAPGNKSIGMLTVSNDLTFMTGANLVAEVNSQNNTSDMIAVTGNLSLDGILYMTEINAQPYHAGNYFKIIDTRNCQGQFSGIFPESPGENLQWDTAGFSATGIIKVVHHTGTDEIPAELTVQLFPNPVVDKLNMVFSGTIGSAKITINDMNGRIIFTSTEKSLKELDLDFSSIDRGVYAIKINCESQSFVRKILKY
ncbi:MAG: autotransporter-associated beta strand repeat-containing protein [Bacteroidales bacterium]|nr:autotransporter-associated beta strand repeat-containing protein [Bacteroidales bacterium]